MGPWVPCRLRAGPGQPKLTQGPAECPGDRETDKERQGGRKRDPTPRWRLGGAHHPSAVLCDFGERALDVQGGATPVCRQRGSGQRFPVTVAGGDPGDGGRRRSRGGGGPSAPWTSCGRWVSLLRCKQLGAMSTVSSPHGSPWASLHTCRRRRCPGWGEGVLAWEAGAGSCPRHHTLLPNWLYKYKQEGRKGPLHRVLPCSAGDNTLSQVTTGTASSSSETTRSPFPPCTLTAHHLFI